MCSVYTIHLFISVVAVDRSLAFPKFFITLLGTLPFPLPAAPLKDDFPLPMWDVLVSWSVSRSLYYL